MNLLKNLSEKTISTIVVLLALSMIIPMTALSTSSAHAPVAWNIPTYAYIETPMNPVGGGSNSICLHVG